MVRLLFFSWPENQISKDQETKQVTKPNQVSKTLHFFGTAAVINVFASSAILSSSFLHQALPFLCCFLKIIFNLSSFSNVLTQPLCIMNPISNQEWRTSIHSNTLQTIPLPLSFLKVTSVDPQKQRCLLSMCLWAKEIVDKEADYLLGSCQSFEQLIL